MSLIETKNLVKIYADGVDIPAVNGVDLAVERGAFICIAGPSGSGKTTLLNLIGALDKPTSGTISYDGQEISSLGLAALSDFRLRKIGFVFQAYNLFPSLTVLENIEYVMLLQGVDKTARYQRVQELLEKVGLKDYLHKTPHQLSGGQQQRVAVARAIAAQPQVVLADEPTANLDSKNAELLVDLMRQLNKEKQITFVFSTHDKLVMDKADKVIFLKDGKII
jgi:putative ABC transport system ATP-binding protein